MHEQSQNSLKPTREDLEKGTYALLCWEEGETLYEFDEDPIDQCPSWKKRRSWSHGEIKQISVQQEDDAGPLPIRQKQLNEEGNLKATLLYMKDFNRLSNDKNTEKNQAETESVESESDNRELGEIDKESSHHVALHIINRLSDGKNNKVPSSEIYTQTSKSDGTIGPALTQLYERKMVEREYSGNKYEYWMSDHGEVVIEKYGKPPDEHLNMQISD